MPTALVEDVQQTATETYGTVPNLFEETNSYTGIAGAVYLAADAALMDGNLSPVDQQVVLLIMARYHDSRYDAVVHARLALDAGLSPKTIDHLLAGDPVPDDRIRALVEATLRSCEKRGWLDPETLRHFHDRGVGRGELYEIFAFIGLKTFTSFTAHLADPAIDGPLMAMEDLLNHMPEKPDSIDPQRLFVS